MHNHHCLLWGLSVTLSLGITVQVQAQLVPDNTLGEENSIIIPVDSLKNQIDGGAIRGSNLFHSFKEFNIGNGKSVYFNNPGAIQNILTRVTGSNPSSILGKLGVLGNANLFLINPNGVIFGQNASLDISGSFTATTTPSVWFDNGLELSATNPQTPPLLEIDLTPGLQYPHHQAQNIKHQNIKHQNIQLQDINLQDIISQGNLTVGKDLNLVGKNLDLTGKLNAGRDLKLQASDTLKIRDSVNLPFIADASRDLLLQGNQSVDIFALNHPDSGLFSGNNLVLRSAKPVLGDARYFSGGNFRIEQLDGNLGDLESPNDPIIRASGDVSFDSYTGASLHILAGGSVNIAGDVTITGADGENGLEDIVTLSTGESLEINGKTQATLDIRAGTTAFGTTGVTGSGIFIPENPSTGESPSSRDVVIGGNIRVDSADGLVFLTNHYSADSSVSDGNIRVEGDIDTSSTSGNGGRIIIDASGDISTQDLNSSSFSNADNAGNGGAITFNAGGYISTSDLYSSSFEGNGGAITFNAGGYISTSDLYSYSLKENGGNITFNAGGYISTSDLYSASFKENGGNITFNAGDYISTSDLYSFSVERNGGAITFNAGDYISTSDLDSSSSERGNEGAITFNAGGDISTGYLNSSSDSSSSKGENEGAIIRSSQNVSFDSYKGASLHILAGGSVNIKGDVTITSADTENGLEETVTLSKGENLQINGKAQATLDIRAGTTAFGTPRITGSGGFTRLNHNMGGDGSSSDIIIGGNIKVTTADSLVFLTNQYSADSSLSGGDIRIGGDVDTSSKFGGGRIIIDASGDILTKSLYSHSFSSSNAGNGGEITLNAGDNIKIQDLKSYSSSLLNAGNGGGITLNAGDNIKIQDLKSYSYSLSLSDAGDTGNGGRIIIDASGDISTQSLDSSSSSFSDIGNAGNAGNGGTITLNAGGNIETQFLHSYSDSSSFSNVGNAGNTGNGGTITLNARGDIETQDLDSFSFSDAGNEGNAGNAGNGGTITLNAGGDIETQDLDSFSSSDAGNPGNAGNAGTITITAKNGDITGLNSPSSVLASFSVSDKGNAGTGGQVTLEAKNKITNLEILTLSSDSNSGEVQLTGFEDLSVINTNIITSKQLQIEIKNPFFGIRTLNLNIGSEGQSGDVTVTSNGNLSFNNSRIESDTKGNNPAGNVTITSSNLLTLNNSFVISNTNSTGPAGSLAISADGGKILIDKSELSAQSNAQGDAGNITLNSSELTLKKQAQISTSTTADSKAGNITINATNSINLLNSSKLVSEATSNATAGNINITTNQLRINDNAQVNVSSKANGSAGSISIDAGNVNLSQGAKISATTESGNGSGITLDGLASLSLNDSEISASTTDGKAGNIEINATDSVKLSDRSTITSEARNSGSAGTLIINTNQFIINNSQLNVSSPSGQAGGLSIMADDLFLNKGELTAETGVRKSADGANIDLKIKDLLWMENESLISAKAWNNANGGNITINNSEGFVIGLPFEDSDVIANAKQGNGGNIKVNTQNIFGLVFRQQRTAKSDITASSKFGVNGQVTVNQLNVDPSSGLLELPSNLEGTAKIKAGCATSAVNNFIVSGKGGLPQSPDDLFTGKTTNTELFDLVTNDSKTSSNISSSNRNINADNQRNQVIEPNQVPEQNNKIVEATGLVFDADGNVELVAQIPEVNSHNSGIYSVSCQDFSAVSK